MESSGAEILPTQVEDEMIKHLRCLRSSSQDYFREPTSNKNWIADNFNLDVSSIIGLTKVQEIEISKDAVLKRNFKDSSLSSFG